MKGLHFSTIDLRNKLSRGRSGHNRKQVRVEIYPLAQSYWHEIQGYLHKEMNLCIKASYYEALSKNNIYPPWSIAFQPTPNLMLRRTQPKEMLTTLSTMNTYEANECKNRTNASTQALKAYY